MEEHRVYRADFGSYAVWIGVLSLPLVLAAAVLAKLGWVNFVAAGMLQAVAISLSFPALAVIWLARYRLAFSSSHLTYRSWFGGSWSVAYSDIAGVSAARVAPISKVPLSAYVQLKSGGQKLVHAKVFSLAAIKDLFELPAAA